MTTVSSDASGASDSLRRAACPSTDELLAHATGDLDPAAAAAIEAHVGSCDACLSVLAEALRALAPDDDQGGAEASAAPRTRRSMPRPGERVGRYVLVEVLGKGAMGVVFTAHDPELDRRVALKVVRTASLGGDATEDELQARLLGEAQAMARLQHPNVVSVYDIGAVDGGVYIAMERVEGVTLRRWLASPRTWREIVAVFAQAADGLAAAHAAGIVHRDFKPDNVLVEEVADGPPRVRVTDFGLARFELRPFDMTASDLGAGDASGRERGSGLRRTRVGTIVGTPAYMAPEQLVAGAPIDARADVFAFGVSLYEALWKRRPYPGTTFEELSRSVARGVPDEPPASKVPRHVRRVVMRALKGRADDRFRSMRELSAALRKNPLERALRVAVPIALVAGVAAAIYVAERVASAPARGCRESAEVAATLWPVDRAARVEAVFRRTGKSFAVDAFTRAAAAMDAYATAWREARIAACDLTHEAGTQSESLLDLRLACLDQRLDESRAVADTLERADGNVVEHAFEAVANLPSPAICAETERLRARVPPPVDASAMATLKEARAKLAQAEAATLVSDWAAAHTAAVEAQALAAAAGDPPAEAEAALVAGRALMELGRLDDAKALLEAAVPQALRGGDERTAARAALAYAQVLGVMTRSSAEPLRWVTIADAHIAHLGRDPELVVSALMKRADIESLVINPRGALLALESARPWVKDDGGPRAVDFLSGLARTYQQLERYADAIATYDRALAAARDTLGPLHPKAAGLALGYSACLMAAGHYEAALRIATRAEAENEKNLATDNPDRATLRHIRGLSLTGLGRFDEAVALHRSAIAVERRLFGDNLGQVAMTTTFVLLAEVRAGRGPDALAVSAEVDALVAKYLPDNVSIRASADVLAALALETAGRFDDAERAFEALRPRLEKAQLASELAWTLDGLGRAATRAGRVDDAATLHQAALDTLTPHYEATSLELAPTLIELGRALGAAREPRAVEVLRRAVAILEGEASDALFLADARLTLAAIEPGHAPDLVDGARVVLAGSPYPRAQRIRERHATLLSH